MVIKRGEIYWADLGEPIGSEPGFDRPVVIVQADPYNSSSLNTTIAVILTTNIRLGAVPGNAVLPSVATGLERDSIANVTGVVTIDRERLQPYPAGEVPPYLMTEIDEGLRKVLHL
jgi:mRNA interferase MazF